MTAYLVHANGTSPTVALGRAICGYRQREGQNPTWVQVGPDVDLAAEAIQRYKLKQTGECRPGHIRVGVSRDDD